jgi:hypothetical protein
MNNTLEDQLHKTRRLDAEHQDRMENTQRELNELKRKLKEALTDDRRRTKSDGNSSHGLNAR